ncbi:hypothetical protein HGRIS_010597 [Hohenbuehelia grisea]|uniref:Uncharacterized protein n=1 Tax=Hohenbuehelia grisea TaxID=104357 RepID=A0ABR3IXJ9_9AGAR
MGYVWPNGQCGGTHLYQLHLASVSYKKKYPQGNVYTKQRAVHDRRYTTNKNQADAFKAQGYRYDGPTAFVFPCNP